MPIISRKCVIIHWSTGLIASAIRRAIKNSYASHASNVGGDKGVIAPTAVLSSIVYTPDYSLEVMRYLYGMGDKFLNKYGFYDAFSETAGWFLQRYLAIDQGPIIVMIENYRSDLLWSLFMNHPDVRNGLDKLGFSYKTD